MRFDLALSTLLVSLSLTACLEPIPDDTITPPGTGTLSGIVRDGCKASPLQNATITIGSRSATSDKAGHYELAGLPAGAHTARIATASYETQDKTVQITDGATTTLEVELLPQLAKLPDSAQLDVLFVVDNSGSMEQEQQALVEAFPSFMQELGASGTLLDLRVGVISTDLGAGNYSLPSCEVTGGDGGKLQNAPRLAGCTAPTDRWIETNAAGSNVPAGTPEQAFACIATLGTRGCGFEQPLAAVLRAVDPSLNINPGFLREQATLAIVVLSDEDDCSAKNSQLFDPQQQALSDPLGPLTSFRCFEFGLTCDVNDRNVAGVRENCVPADDKGWLEAVAGVGGVIEKLQAIKTRPGSLFFGVIGGPTNPVIVAKDGPNPVLKPSCQTQNGFAVPALRLKTVVDAFAPRSSFDSICGNDFSAPLRSMAKKIVATALTNVCTQP